MGFSLKSFILPAAAVAYVCFGAVSTRGGAWPWVALVGLTLGLALVWRRTDSPRAGEDHTEVVARRVVRAVAWGAALWVAARTGSAGRAGLDAVANAGVGTATVAALVGLARVSSLGGLLAAPSATRSLDAAAFAAFLWAIAVAAPLTRAILPEQMVRLDPLAIDYATTSAAAGSLLVLVATSLRLRWLRRLELGAADRATGALALVTTALLVAVPAALLDVAAPDRVLPVAVLLAALGATWAAATRDPTSVSRTLRGVLALAILGAPTLLVTGFVARSAPAHAGAVVLVASILAILIGLIARRVSSSLAPEQSRWLDAIDAASRGALQPEPDAAIRAALAALSKATAVPGARPELWRSDPEEVLSVDLAGYLHVDKTAAPERLYELALAEPERTLRAEVLAALEVRRPEVRPLLAWFKSRKAFSATVVLDEDGPLGFLLLPQGARSSAMSLEEARAVRALTDRVSALIAVSSALARSRERELAAIARADRADDEVARLSHIIGLETGRHVAHAERVARRAKGALYSPAARLASEELERLGRLGAPVVLRTPPGVYASAWAALVHLSSARRGGPLVVVDGTSGPEHELALWQDPDSSPLALADGGTLCLLDAAALPLPVQEHIGRTLSRHADVPVRGSVLPVSLVTSLRTPLAELVEAGRVAKNLARWLGSAEVALPSLGERAEDIRALALGALARSGLEKEGRPMGLDTSALRLLSEHDWPGNDRELEDVLSRAARAATGSVLTAADLAAVGFSPVPHLASSATPLPVITRRRMRARRPPRGR
ncbi:MAG: hypothetical protein AMXMBFR56_39010 [Polyangiaceae bacterium]